MTLTELVTSSPVTVTSWQFCSSEAIGSRPSLVTHGCTSITTSSSYTRLSRINRKPSSHTDLHAHAGSAADNRVTLIFDLLTLPNECRRALYTPTKFGVGSTSRFSFTARTLAYAGPDRDRHTKSMRLITVATHHLPPA